MANPLHPQPSGPSVELEAALSVIPSLPRAVLERLVQRAIDRMDEMDGDPDLESEGDELDGQYSDDLAWFGRISRQDYGPGDPDDAEDTHDQEAIGEREPEHWEGGGGDVPPWSVPQGTGLNR